MGGWAQAARARQRVDLKIDRGERLGVIPANFMGLGYEISSVATRGLLSAQNRQYVGLVRRLCPRGGVVRVGGNTSDYSSYSAGGKAVAAPKSTVVNDESLRQLGEFLNATGCGLIWGLNLGLKQGNGSVEDAVAEARAVTRAAGNQLLAFEIGNEPDLYVHEGHRRSYSYEEYLREYRRYKAAIRAGLPQAAFAGPDAAVETEWAERFAADEGHDLRLLTHHYYREGQSPRSTADKLLRPDPKLSAMLDRMQAASKAAGVPYRICETNSFSGGGRPGVSDTFAAALWVLDYLCVLAWHGAAGVNIETGMNQLGFVSSYSPIGDDQHGHYTAAPEYDGMLAFAPCCGGERLGTHYDPGGLNLTAYAVADARGSITTIIVNKDRDNDAEVRIDAGLSKGIVRIVRLMAPSLESKTGVALASNDQGRGKSEPAGMIHVPAASAALVTLGE